MGEGWAGRRRTHTPRRRPPHGDRQTSSPPVDAQGTPGRSAQGRSRRPPVAHPSGRPTGINVVTQTLERQLPSQLLIAPRRLGFTDGTEPRKVRASGYDWVPEQTTGTDARGRTQRRFDRGRENEARE